MSIFERNLFLKYHTPKRDENQIHSVSIATFNFEFSASVKLTGLLLYAHQWGKRIVAKQHQVHCTG
jgi:hypothetical protein